MPSPNEQGYQIVERVDANHVLILVEPQADMMVKIQSNIDDINRKLNSEDNKIEYITNADIDAMFDGTYIVDDI